jgi:hypothetical protein
MMIRIATIEIPDGGDALVSQSNAINCRDVVCHGVNIACDTAEAKYRAVSTLYTVKIRFELSGEGKRVSCDHISVEAAKSVNAIDKERHSKQLVPIPSLLYSSILSTDIICYHETRTCI